MPTLPQGLESQVNAYPLGQCRARGRVRDIGSGLGSTLYACNCSCKTNPEFKAELGSNPNPNPNPNGLLRLRSYMKCAASHRIKCASSCFTTGVSSRTQVATEKHSFLNLACYNTSIIQEARACMACLRTPGRTSIRRKIQ